MPPTRSSPIFRIVLVMKFFAWGCAFLAACAFFLGLYEAYQLYKYSPFFSQAWLDALLQVFSVTLKWLAAMAGFFWLAYVLLLLNRIAIHSRRQTRVMFNILHPPIPSSKIPDLAPQTLPDLAPAPNIPPARDPTLPRGFMITGLDKNRLMFRLTYEWITREDALAKASADGLVEILDVQPLKK